MNANQDVNLTVFQSHPSQAYFERLGANHFKGLVCLCGYGVGDSRDPEHLNIYSPACPGGASFKGGKSLQRAA